VSIALAGRAHFLAQFFSTTDAGPEHELAVQVFMHNLYACEAVSTCWAAMGNGSSAAKMTDPASCKRNVKQW